MEDSVVVPDDVELTESVVDAPVVVGNTVEDCSVVVEEETVDDCPVVVELDDEAVVEGVVVELGTNVHSLPFIFTPRTVGTSSPEKSACHGKLKDDPAFN